MSAPTSKPRWRTPAAATIAPWRLSRPRRHRYALLALLLALVGGVFGLAAWWAPRPRPLFIPLWITEYPSPLGNNWPARQDRQSLLAGNYFARPMLTAPGIDQRLLRRTLNELPKRREDLVIYLSAYALTNEQGQIEFLAAGAEPESREARIPLREVLTALEQCPARGKLLILDLFWPIASPATGVMANDASARLAGELAAVPDPTRIVLTSCGPGEVAGASPVLGRSVFGHYVELGLRGYADISSPTSDGRVTALELGRFVQARVSRWARENAIRPQTPQLLGQGVDFSLLIIEHGMPREPVAFQPVVDFPPALVEGWRLRDAWAKGNLLELTGLIHQLERELLGEEARLTYGGSAAEAATNATAITSRSNSARLQLTQNLAAPPPRTLFEAAQMGTPLDATLLAQVRQAATQWGQAIPSQPIEKQPAAEAELLKTFATQHAATPATSLALAVFVAAASDPQLSPAACRFYDSLISGVAPQPQYVETFLLRNLAKLPANNPTTPEPALRLLLRSTQQLATASTRPRTLPWCLPELNSAAQNQYEGTYLYLAEGYARRESAEQQLQQASDQFDEIRELQQILDDALQASDLALLELPSWSRLLVHRPEWLATWLANAESASQVLAALAPHSGAADSAARSVAGERVSRVSMALALQRQVLHEPISVDNLTQLAERLTSPDVVLDDLALAQELLETPLLDASTRGKLWSLQRSAGQRTAAHTLEVDVAAQLIYPGDVPANDFGAGLHSEQEAERHRQQICAALERLAGLSPPGAEHSPPSPASKTEHVAPLVPALNAALAEPGRGDLPQARVAAVRSGLVAALAAEPTQSPGYLAWRTALRGQWAWRAKRFWYAEADRQNPAFSGDAARQYARAAQVRLEPQGVEFLGSSQIAGLTLETPSVAVSVPWHQTAGGAATQPVCQVLSPCDAVEASAPSDGAQGQPFKFDVQLALDRLADLSNVRGVLVRLRAGDQTYHQPLTIEGLEQLEHFAVVLSTNSKAPTPALESLRVRPTGLDQTFYFYVTNPRYEPREVLFELEAGASYSSKQLIGPRATALVMLTGLPKPEQSLLPGAELSLSVRDPATGKLLGCRRVAIEVQAPREYLSVAGALYVPGPIDANRLSVTVAAPAPLVPPAKVALTLPAERIPGFAGVSGGALRAVVANSAPVTLTASGLRLSPVGNDNGYFYLDVDECPRAFIYATTFARSGQPTTPIEELRPSVRLDAPSVALAASNFEFGTEADNAPAGATLDVSICQSQGDTLTVERHLALPNARNRQTLVSPSGPNGGILVRATMHDWRPTLDASGLVGHRYLRIRMLNSESRELASAVQPITFDDQPPQGLQFVQAGPNAISGSKINVSAACWQGLTAVTDAKFFLSAPVEGKLPAGAVPVDGKPVGVGSTQWSTTLALPEKLTGPLPITVQFTNQIGLSSLATTTIQVHEPIDTSIGRIAGVVNEGPLPQAGLQVQLTDAEGKDPQTAQTSAKGTFAFEKLKPGEYKLSTSKPASDRKAAGTVTVVGGQTADATLDLSL